MITFLVSAFVVVLLVGVNSLYVAGEFSTVSARKTRIIQMAENGNRLARSLLKVLEDPHHLDNYIAASQVGITLSSIVLGIYGQQQIAPYLSPWLSRLPFVQEATAAGLAATLVLLFLTTLQVIFGELLPKSIGIQYPETLALATALPMRWSADFLLKPLIVLLNGSGALLLRLLGQHTTSEHAHIHSPEEILILVQESHQAGLIDADERRLLRNAFRVTETTAGDIAVPRNHLIAASVDKPLLETLELAGNSAYTRIPVYEDNIDNIIGFVHLRDLFNLYLEDPQASIRQLVREAPFIPETLTTTEAWNRLNEENSYLAVVFDEYGGTSGLLTREDLIEAIFGEVQDEFDQEPALIRLNGEGRLVVRGDMLITYLNDILHIDLPHEISHTLGGLVQERLGRLPKVGDTVEVRNVCLRVETVTDGAVNSVCIELPPDVEVPTPEVIS